LPSCSRAVVPGRCSAQGAPRPPRSWFRSHAVPNTPRRPYR